MNFKKLIPLLMLAGLRQSVPVYAAEIRVDTNQDFTSTVSTFTVNNAVFNFDSGTLYANAGTNRVGIGGNTAPLDLLTLGAGTSQISFGGSDQTAGMWFRNDGAAGVFSSNQDNLFIGYGGTSGTTIHIGNANPGAMTIRDDAPTSSFVMANTGIITLTVQFVPYTRTSVQLGTLAPTAVGAIVRCSDCTTATICTSSGTGAGAWVLTSNKTTACDD